MWNNLIFAIDDKNLNLFQWQLEMYRMVSDSVSDKHHLSLL